MVITRISRGYKPTPNLPLPGEGTPKRDYSPPKNSPAHSLKSGRIWMFFLRTVRLFFFKLSWRYLPRNNTSHSRWLKSLLAQGSGDLSPAHFGVQLLPSCVSSLELSWEILSRNLILVVFIRMHTFAVLNGYLRSPRAHRCIECPLLFLPWLDLWAVNPGVMSWYLDCCGDRKYYRVGALPCELELSLWGPIFPDFS